MTVNDPFHPAPRRRVLIADDDDSLRRLLCRLLEDAGYVVEHVADGAAALARLRMAPPDLLVSDAVMPGLDGFSLCRAIRSEPQLEHLPVVLASASYQAPHDERLARAAGASAFLRKPATLTDWLGAVRQAHAAPPPVPAPEREFTVLHTKVLGTQLTRKLGELDEQSVRLGASEARFRDVFDQINDCLFIIEPNSGRILDANRRACELLGLIESGDECVHVAFGCPYAELLSLTFTKIGPPEEAETVQRALLETTNKGHLLFERHLRRHDGTIVPCEVNARHILRDGRDLIVSVVRDITERKQAEQMLQDSEERFRATFEQAAVGIAQVGPDGRWLHVNQKLCDIVGYSRAELLERTFQDITYPEDLDTDLAFVRRMLAGEIQSYGMEKRYLRKDGTLVWIYLTVGLVRQPTGEAKYFISVVEDISERKRAETALQHSEQRLRNIIDGLGPSMFVGLLTTEGVVLEANQQALAAAGLKPEDVLGKPVEETYWFSYSEESKYHLRAAITRAARGETSRYDVQIRVTENQFIPLDFTLQPFRDTTGRVVLLVPSAIVITERKQAEQALREREHFLQRVLDTEPGTVYIYDLVARHNVFINRHWLSAYGYTTEETQAMGETLFAQIFHPDDLTRVVAHHTTWQQAPDGETRSIDYRIRSKTGGWHWLHSRETVFARDPAGKVTQILGIAHDITERKTAETALAERDTLLNETGRIAKVGGWEFDPVTGKGSWTDEVARIHDLDPSAETSAEIGLSFYHGEHRAAIERAVQEAMESGKPYDLELELVSAKGVRKWVRTIGNPRVEHNRVVRITGSFQDITDRKQAEAALRENTRQLETLSRRLLAAQEDERRNIARELHDELGQALTAIKINLQARERFKGNAREELDAENIRIVDATLQQVRRLALTLRPSMLDDLGLGSALRWMADQQAERGGFAMHFGADFSGTRLAPELETACFRIAQEALTNIVRHAQAHRVTIELRHARDALVMTIQDDGRGFDAVAMGAQARTGGSFGLLGMQERATLAGGSLEIESAPNQGTILRVRFPLRAREEKR